MPAMILIINRTITGRQDDVETQAATMEMMQSAYNSNENWIMNIESKMILIELQLMIRTVVNWRGTGVYASIRMYVWRPCALTITHHHLQSDEFCIS